jgi:hypothetical protein
MLRILVDPRQADGLMLMPNHKKLRIGGPVVSAKFRIFNPKNEENLN